MRDKYRINNCACAHCLPDFLSKRTVLITHSNYRALVPGHPRLKTDEAIKQMAAPGRAMGITGVRMFCEVLVARLTRF